MALYTIFSLPIDLMNVIINEFNILALLDKLYLLASCKTFLNEIKIYNLQSDLIGDNALQQIKYSHVNNLNISFNDNIKTISHLSNLTTLDIAFVNNIEANSLANMSKLLSLNIQGFSNIVNITHLTSLTKLRLTHSMFQYHIISTLTNLTKLDITDNETTISIKNLTNITYLRMMNTKITDNNNLSLLPNLTFLDIRGTNVQQVNIEKLYSLTELYAPTRLNFSHLTNLRTLNELHI